MSMIQLAFLSLIATQWNHRNVVSRMTSSEPMLHASPTYIDIPMYVYVYMHVYKDTYVYTCVYVYIHICMHNGFMVQILQKAL